MTPTRSTGSGAPTTIACAGDALAIGMPPSGGVAVGLDRLIMVLAGKKELGEVIAFPFTHDFPE